VVVVAVAVIAAAGVEAEGTIGEVARMAATVATGVYYLTNIHVPFATLIIACASSVVFTLHRVL